MSSKPNTLSKNFHLCFSSVINKRPQSQHPFSHSSSAPPPHHHHNNRRPPPSSTLIKTYNSLYEAMNSSESDHTPAAYFSASTAASDDEGDSFLAPTTPDLTAAYASRRFFISSPGMSNSIVEYSLSSSSSSSSTSPPAEEVAGGVPVQTYSPDPYVDFRKSMQEMVEAREMEDVQGNKEAWDYLQELLMTYLTLNPKSTHKYIVGAFSDLVASLLFSPHNHHFANHDC